MSKTCCEDFEYAIESGIIRWNGAHWFIEAAYDITNANNEGIELQMITWILMYCPWCGTNLENSKE